MMFRDHQRFAVLLEVTLLLPRSPLTVPGPDQGKLTCDTAGTQAWDVI